MYAFKYRVGNGSIYNLFLRHRGFSTLERLTLNVLSDKLLVKKKNYLSIDVFEKKHHFSKHFESPAIDGSQLRKLNT